MQIVVRDTGIGIRKEDRDKIFLILGKLEATASINTSGVGLGLSTCKKLAEALKGDIFIVDEEESDQQSLLIDSSSSLKLKKPEGTAIALVLKCPEINEKFKD